MKQLRNYQSNAVQECLQKLRENDEPVLLMASVGAGKSLIIATILQKIQNSNKKALCIVNNAELVRNNCITFKEQGGKASIYCASLNEKNCNESIIFGTPQSILNGINKNERIAQIKFNLIVVDEAHMIDYNNHAATFMRILGHYKTQYEPMRVLGATGTNFRYKGQPIVGESCLFRSQVGNISTSWLIEQDYLVRPKFEIDKELMIDFSSVKINQMGKFDNKQLETVIEKNFRLTSKIVWNLRYIVEKQNRFGAFIFCSTLRHCEEAALALPEDKTAIITAKTPQKERIRILDAARCGEIKYLINVQVLTVGIDVPGFDTLLFLRPTESLVLLVQMIGRALRLHPGKSSALVLDCAGNLDRHQDWDDPIILDAIKQTQSEAERIFPCPHCETLNTIMARRCIGLKEKKRCDFYFDWKDCPSCNGKVDITSRYCPHCEYELIDPNTKLSPLVASIIDVDVEKAKYEFINNQIIAYYRFNKDKTISETYYPLASEKSKNYFYGNFVRHHLNDSSKAYPHLQNPVYLRLMIQHLKTPTHLKLKWDGAKWLIQKKVFQDTLL